MRVLHVAASTDLKWGGPVAMFHGLCPVLAALGAENNVISAVGRRVGTSPQPVPGATTTIVRTSLLAPAWTGHSFEAARVLAGLVANHDVVHVHELWHHLGYAAAKAARKAGKPYIVTPHGELEPWALKRHAVRKGIYYRAVQKAVLQQAAAIHALTEGERQQILALGLHAPVTVIPNGTALVGELSSKEEFLRDYPDLRGRKVVLFLGRLTRKKGLNVLAGAVAMLAEPRPDLRYVVAGPDEDGSGAEMAETLSRTGTRGLVTFTGMLTGAKLAAARAAADVFTLPSYSEGFSMAVLEAMASGVPVVISRQCYFPEVEQAGAGVVVEPTPQLLAAALNTVLSDAARLRLMGASARRMIEAGYTWGRVAARFMSLYESVSPLRQGR